MVFPVALFPVPFLPIRTMLRPSVKKEAGKIGDHGLIRVQLSECCQLFGRECSESTPATSHPAALSPSTVPGTRSGNQKRGLDRHLCPTLIHDMALFPSLNLLPPSGNFSDSLAPCECHCLYYLSPTQLRPASTSHPLVSVPAAVKCSYCQLMLTAAKSP